MADYLTSACAGSDFGTFAAYEINNCDFLESEIVALGLTTPGTTLSCVSDLTEVQNAITARTFQVVTGIGTLNEPTQNTIDVPFRFGPTVITQDLTQVINFDAPFIPENHEFWDEVIQAETVGQAFYVTAAGLVFQMRGTVSITGGYADNGGIQVVRVSLTRNYKGIDKPFQALGPIFGANAA